MSAIATWDWDDSFSGAWAQQPDPLALRLSPGPFPFGQPINDPRIVAAPLEMGLSTWRGWLGGRAIEAWIQRQAGLQRVEPQRMRPGQVLDEREVLTHSTAESTIVAELAGTRVLAVPVDSFDAMLERNPDFARRVLELETRRLRRLTREATGAAGL